MTEQEIKDIERLNYNESYFERLPDERRTKAVWEAAFGNNPVIVDSIPKEYLTVEMASKAIHYDGSLLQHIPAEFISTDVLFKAIEENPQHLKFVPAELKSKELCEMAVNKEPYALVFTPNELKTHEMCENAFKRTSKFDVGILDIIHHIPYPDLCIEAMNKIDNSEIEFLDVFLSLHSDVLTKDLIRYAFEKDSQIFMFTPIAERDYDLCLEAVKRNGRLILSVPESFQNEELCKIAVSSDPHALPLIPEKLLNDDLINLAVIQSGDALLYVPDEYKTMELYEKAINNAQNPEIMRCIDDPDMCLKAFEKFKDHDDSLSIFTYMADNDKGWSKELAEKMVDKFPTFMERIPVKYVDRELCERAADNHPYALFSIPDEYKSITMCITAVDRNPFAIAGIKPELKNENFYKFLVDRNPQNIEGIPIKDRTKDICQIVLDRTFKNDENTGLLLSITHPEVFLDMIKSIEEKNQRDLLLMGMNEISYSKDLVNHLLEKDPLKIAYMPHKFVSDKDYEKMLERHSHAFGYIHPSRVTPEMCLIAVKNDASMKSLVPAHIVSGENIYSFNKTIESRYGLKLKVDDVKDLYKGNPLKIDRISTEKGVLRNQEIIYSKPLGPNLIIKPAVNLNNRFKLTEKTEHTKKKSSGMKL